MADPTTAPIRGGATAVGDPAVGADTVLPLAGALDPTHTSTMVGPLGYRATAAQLGPTTLNPAAVTVSDQRAERAAATTEMVDEALISQTRRVLPSSGAAWSAATTIWRQWNRSSS